MKISRVISSIFLGLLSLNNIAQKQNINTIQTVSISDSVSYSYKKPTFNEIYKYIPNDIVQFANFTIQNENLKWTSLAIGSTLVLIPFDQQLTNEAINLGQRIDWDQDHSYNKIAGFLRIIPNDINSAVYYLANGGTTLLLSGTFYTIGKIQNNYRALNTSNELVEVLLSVGLVTQTIKRITGRQSPSEALISGNPGGHWTPFPSFSAFQSNTPNYDAMPSGHIATFMATITVISTNYPEIKWIKPIGYALMGIVGFEMVSSKVHWVSDYPLAILIGYAIGKNVANRRIIKNKREDWIIRNKEVKLKTNFNFNYTNQYKMIGISLTF